MTQNNKQGKLAKTVYNYTIYCHYLYKNVFEKDPSDFGFKKSKISGLMMGLILQKNVAGSLRFLEGGGVATGVIRCVLIATVRRAMALIRLEQCLELHKMCPLVYTS